MLTFSNAGRKHQLRMHAAFALGAPMVGDSYYGSRTPAGTWVKPSRHDTSSFLRQLRGSLQLHCRTLQVRPPPPPGDHSLIFLFSPNFWRTNSHFTCTLNFVFTKDLEVSQGRTLTSEAGEGPVVPTFTAITTAHPFGVLGCAMGAASLCGLTDLSMYFAMVAANGRHSPMADRYGFYCMYVADEEARQGGMECHGATAPTHGHPFCGARVGIFSHRVGRKQCCCAGSTFPMPRGGVVAKGKVGASAQGLGSSDLL